MFAEFNVKILNVLNLAPLLESPSSTVTCDDNHLDWQKLNVCSAFVVFNTQEAKHLQAE